MSEQSAEAVKDPVDPVEESATSESTAAAATKGDASPGESAPPKAEEESEAQKRIRRLVWEREEERREKAKLEARIQELEQSRSQKTTDEVGDPPLESDYDDVSQYKQAMRAWVGKANEAQFQQYQSKTEAQKQAEDRQRSLSGYREKVAQYAADHPDFVEDVQQARVPINDAMQDVLVSSEKPAELTHYLAKNPDHALQISRMTPVQAARELAKVELTMAQAERKVSNAPPPMQEAGDGSEASSEITGKESVAEFLAKRGGYKL